MIDFKNPKDFSQKKNIIILRTNELSLN